MTAKELRCSYCGAVFGTRREQWDHTSACTEMKQAMRDLRAAAGLEETGEE